MDIDEDRSENKRPANKCQFMHRVDELMNAFNQFKFASSCPPEVGNITQPFKSWLKLLEKIRVWPPSVNLLNAELTLVCNCLLVDISGRSHRGSKSAFVSTQLNHLVCKTITRVLQFAMKVPVVHFTYHKEDTDVETLMKTVFKTVEDPIARFRLLDCLGQLVLLCSICCITKRQQDGPEKTMALLVVLDQLMKTVGHSVLQEILPYQQGLVMCRPEKTEDIVAETSLCVGDVARLVMLSCHLIAENDSIKHKRWQWLDTFLQCKKLFKEKQYNIAMEKLQAELSQPLDPEQKSMLLCQFAECYLQQGCPQLAIQTYKDALQIYRRHHSVFLHIANVYKGMGQKELELESLNLLVKVLTDKFIRNEQQPLTTEIDVIIMSAFQIMPNITFSYAVHLLARCCTKLHRYKEAANHYLTLLKLLENAENFTSEVTTDGPQLNTDVKELIVEAVEALSLAQQNTECISLCDEFYPILSTDNSSSHLSTQSFPDISINNSKEDFNINNSQHNLFDQSQHSECADKIVTSSSKHEASSTAKLRHSGQFETVIHENFSLTFKCLSNISSLSGLRVTSESDDKYIFPQLYFNNKDAWWSRSLPVRLLLSKADALVATQGFTDQTSDCLVKALNLLMDSKTSIFVQGRNDFDSPGEQPPLKRRKLVSTDITDLQQSKVALAQEKPHEEDKLAGSCEFQVSKTWKKHMVNVSLRMAKASLKRLQMSSVLNSCHLVLQLDPHNVSAHYMKTVVLRGQSHQKDMASKLWLRERGIDCSSSVAILQLVLEEKQKEVRNAQSKQTTECKKWWHTSEFQLLSLDVTCLENIIQSTQKQDQTS